ncbi:MAG TPA: DUF1499 domain-containing protein [Candidatus Binatus sp.]|nr:DUF1499 domain-containing protein [Candidatus Binatus sp.]
MQIYRRFARMIGASFIVMSLFSCSGTRPANLGIKDGRLAACPSSPNCVSSDAADSSHSIAAFELTVPAIDAWRAMRVTVENLPRTKIITVSDDYLYAECSSAVFGFVDDLELHLRPAQNSVAVRSASRLGKSDFGVNRKRVEKLRGLLAKQGVIR